MTTTPHFGTPIDRDQEAEDIAANGVVAPGKPTAKGSVLDQLAAKFKALDEDRHKTFRVTARNGEHFWLELCIDVDEDELGDARRRSLVGTRSQKRAGEGEVSQARLAAEVVNLKCTRIWAEDPTGGAQALPDPVEGGDLQTRSKAWCEALGFPEDPIGGLRHLLGDLGVIDLYSEFSEAAGVGDGAEALGPTNA